MPECFIAAARSALSGLGPDLLGQVGQGLINGLNASMILDGIALSPKAEAAGALLRVMDDGGTSPGAAGTYLTGLADGYHLASAETTDLVFTGPRGSRVPLRDTQQALLDVINSAHASLLLTTYSAKPVELMLRALRAAREREVQLDIVVETLLGAGSALQGSDPALAFGDLPGARLWHWPLDRREAADAKMHAKLALADRSVLLVTSANLTGSGLARNLEAGMLVRDVEIGRRAADHFAGLMASGTLQRY